MIFGLVITWLVINFRGDARVAYGFVAGGLVRNGSCLLVNGRMPFWLPAARAAGLPEQLLHEGSHVKNVAAGAHTKLLLLGDVIPVPGLAKVFGIGDIAIAAGIVVLVVTGMRLSRTQISHVDTDELTGAAHWSAAIRAAQRLVAPLSLHS